MEMRLCKSFETCRIHVIETIINTIEIGIMRLIDCQTHIFAPEFADILFKNRGPVQGERSEDSIIVHFGKDQSLKIRDSDYMPEKKLADMDTSGIGISILSPNIPGPEDLDFSLRDSAARVSNDYTVSLCRKYPDRFRGLAVLPFTTIQEVIKEYRRSIHQLGLSGIVLLSQVGGRGVDDPEWEQLFEEAEADGIPIVLHPTVPTWASAINDYSMIPMMGFMVDHSFAMLRLILSGILERHPALKIVHPHCGGVLPYVMPRIDEQTEVKRRGREHIRTAPSNYYKKVFLDIVSPSPQTVRFALNYSGIDRMLFGSDHPWIKIDAMVQVLNDLGLTAEQLDMIGYTNASRLFNIV